MTGNALEDRDFRLAVRRLREFGARRAAALVVIGADEYRGLHRGSRGCGWIQSRVDDHDRDVLGVRFHEHGNDFARAARRDEQRLDTGLNQVLDDLHLLLDINLALGRLNHQIDSQSIRSRLGAGLHFDEEGAVQSLQHQSDARLGGGRGLRRRRAAAGQSQRAGKRRKRDKVAIHMTPFVRVKVSGASTRPESRAARRE